MENGTPNNFTHCSSTEMAMERYEHIPGEIWRVWLEAQNEIRNGNQPAISYQHGFILEKVKDPNAQMLVVDSFKIQSFLDQRTSSRHRSQATADFSDHSDHSDDERKTESGGMPQSTLSSLSNLSPPTHHLVTIPKNVLKP